MASELSLSTELLQTVNAELLPGHRFELVENGRVFDVLEQLAREAKNTIHVALYMWFPGKAADRVVAALCEAAGRGVEVRLVLDASGTRVTREDLGRMERPGVGARGAPGRPSSYQGMRAGVVELAYQRTRTGTFESMVEPSPSCP